MSLIVMPADRKRVSRIPLVSTGFPVYAFGKDVPKIDITSAKVNNTNALSKVSFPSPLTIREDKLQ